MLLRALQWCVDIMSSVFSERDRMVVLDELGETSVRVETPWCVVGMQPVATVVHFASDFEVVSAGDDADTIMRLKSVRVRMNGATHIFRFFGLRVRMSAAGRGRDDDDDDPLRVEFSFEFKGDVMRDLETLSLCRTRVIHPNDMLAVPDGRTPVVIVAAAVDSAFAVSCIGVSPSFKTAAPLDVLDDDFRDVDFMYEESAAWKMRVLMTAVGDLSEARCIRDHRLFGLTPCEYLRDAGLAMPSDVYVYWVEATCNLLAARPMAMYPAARDVVDWEPSLALNNPFWLALNHFRRFCHGNITALY